jgi:hypothetical protein
MLLEHHERKRFCEYCRQQAASCEAIARQLEILGAGLNPVTRFQRNKALAYAVVASDLEGVEDMTIEGGGRVRPSVDQEDT